MKVIDNIYLYSPQQNYERNEIYHIEIENGEIAHVNKGAYSGDSKEVIDGNKMVLSPSFTDSHLHLLRFGLMKNELDLREYESWEKVKEVLSDAETQDQIEDDDWIIARGLMDNQYDDIARLAVASDVDEIEDEKPVFLLHRDGHECVVNNTALERVKEDDNLEDKHEEFIEKDADGNWTGRFKDTAVHFIKYNFRDKYESEIVEALEQALPHLAKYGITSVHPDDLNYAGNYGLVWKSYRRLEEEDKLTVRAFLHHYVFKIEDMHYFLEHSDKRTGDGTDKVRIGAFKIFVDGTHRLHTAALEKPYHDQPENRGILNYSQDELNEMVSLAENNNMQVAMHCIGDRAVKTALNAIEQAGNSMRHRIIHADTLSDELLNRLSEMKPCIETQPGFLLDEWNRYAGYLGEERGGYCGMGKSMIETGSTVTLSSDTPIGPLNPFDHIFAALNRTDRDGNPDGGWMPREKIDFTTAFTGYTSTPAYLEFMEEKKGLLKEGMKADFVLFNQYPDEFAVEELLDMQVQQTWMDGKKIYDKAGNEDNSQ